MGSQYGEFHWLDYVIFSVILLMSCGIGGYYMLTNKKQSKHEYLLGSRRLKWFPVALSLVVSNTSGISLLGKPAEVYLHGVQAFIGILGVFLAVCFTWFTFVPLLFNLQLTSSYQVCKRQFLILFHKLTFTFLCYYNSVLLDFHQIVFEFMNSA